MNKVADSTNMALRFPADMGAVSSVDGLEGAISRALSSAQLHCANRWFELVYDSLDIEQELR